MTGVVHQLAAQPVYLREYWPLLSALRRALRSETKVQVAILYGSQARGSAGQDSDVDIAVIADDAFGIYLDALRQWLSRAVGRSVEVIDLDERHRHNSVTHVSLNRGDARASRHTDHEIVPAWTRSRGCTYMNWDPQRVATMRAVEEDLTEAELMARDEAEDAELLAARTPQEFAKIFLRQYRECADHEVISAEQSNREIREMLDELDERDSRRADAARATWSSPPDGTAV